jgi:hypothetical protein
MGFARAPSRLKLTEARRSLTSGSRTRGRTYSGKRYPFGDQVKIEALSRDQVQQITQVGVKGHLAPGEANRIKSQGSRLGEDGSCGFQG